MNDGNLRTFFSLYPRKVDELITETEKHGDPIFAAKNIGISDLWAKDLLAFDDPTADINLEYDILAAKERLLQAKEKGLSNRPHHAKALFTEALALHASPTEATAAQPWYDRAYFDALRVKDPKFDAKWIEAHEAAVDSLRLEAWRRAVEGVDEPQVYKGQFQYQKDPFTGETKLVALKKRSDTMLLTLLKRYDDAFQDKIHTETTHTIDLQASRALTQISTEDLQVLQRYIDAPQLPDPDIIDVEVKEEDVDSGSD